MRHLIHKIWLGGEIPDEYWENTKKLADHLTPPDEKLILWVDGWINGDGMRDKYNYPNVEILNIETLQEKTELAEDPERYILEEKSFNKYQYFWFHVFREMIGPNSNYSQASDFLRYEILRQYPGAYIDNDIKLHYKSEALGSSSRDQQVELLFRRGVKLHPTLLEPKDTSNSDVIECSTNACPTKMVEVLLDRIEKLNNMSLMSLKRMRKENEAEPELRQLMENVLGNYYNAMTPGLLTLWLGPDVVRAVFRQKEGTVAVDTSCQKFDAIYFRNVTQLLEETTRLLKAKINSLFAENHLEHNTTGTTNLIDQIGDILITLKTKTETGGVSPGDLEEIKKQLKEKLSLLRQEIDPQKNSRLGQFGIEECKEHKMYEEAVLAYVLALQSADKKIFDKTLIYGKFVVGDAPKVGKRWNDTDEPMPRGQEEELFVNTLKKIEEKDIDLLISIMYKYSQSDNNQKEVIKRYFEVNTVDNKITTEKLENLATDLGLVISSSSRPVVNDSNDTQKRRCGGCDVA